MFRVFALIFSLCVWSAALTAAELPPYAVNAGDVLQVSVWKEPDLQLEVLVRPDGGFSVPLIGEVAAAGKTVEALQDEITKRLNTYVPDAVVTVAIRQLSGDKIYVLGKVNRPGEYALNRYVDVMQALSIAGGTTAFAALDDIAILRRDGDGQRALEFKYSQVSQGKHLEQNIILQSGDVVVVP
jgi:polysaccharide export outer membrane protein